VSLAHGDRLLVCPFCRARLALLADPYLRYLLPPRDPDLSRYYFVPYWRMKGQLYSVIPFEVGHAIVDRTMPACDLAGLPQTLGVRPQAMPLRLARAGAAARLLKVELKEAAAIGRCQQDCRKLEDLTVVAEAFIGTGASLLYLPIEIRGGAGSGAGSSSASRADAGFGHGGDHGRDGGMYDGVLDRRITTVHDPVVLAAELERRVEEDDRSGVRFIAALCPSCGSDLAGEPDTLVLLCRACGTAWTPGTSRLDPVPFSAMPVAWDVAAHLPFWRVRARLEGCSLSSFADLIRFANLPSIPGPEEEAAPVWFWFPAFKVNPEHFLRLSRTLVVAQPDPGGGHGIGADAGSHAFAPRPGGVPEPFPCPVTLWWRDGAGIIRILLAELAQPKPTFFAGLEQVRVSIEDPMLVYLPFTGDTRELRHPGLPMALAPKLLDYGRGL
jgi:hypothetical protein